MAKDTPEDRKVLKEEFIRKRLAFFPAPATSHIMYHSNVARALSAMGHDVYIIMPAAIAAKGTQLLNTNIRRKVYYIYY